MKSLPVLLRLAKRALDELRLELAAVSAKREELDVRLASLAEAVRAEQRAALGDYMGARAYGGYALASARTRRAIQSEAEVLDAQIAHLRELVTQAHTEARKLERLLELRAEQAARAEAKRADEELDESATLRAARTGASIWE